MVALTLILHIFIGSTLAGAMVIGVLAAGYDTALMIFGAAAAGFVLGFPVSWMVTRRIAGKLR